MITQNLVQHTRHAHRNCKLRGVGRVMQWRSSDFFSSEVIKATTVWVLLLADFRKSASLMTSPLWSYLQSAACYLPCCHIRPRTQLTSSTWQHSSNWCSAHSHSLKISTLFLKTKHMIPIQIWKRFQHKPRQQIELCIVWQCFIQCLKEIHGKNCTWWPGPAPCQIVVPHLWVRCQNCTQFRVAWEDFPHLRDNGTWHLCMWMT